MTTLGASVPLTLGRVAVVPLPPDTGAALLAAGVDAAGNPPEVSTDPDGGAPLRCCLRDSRPGERLVLAAFTPPGPAGVYQETGPVFVHADPCAGPAPGVVPAVFAHRDQVLRAYSAAGRIVGGQLVPAGGDLLGTAEGLLADAEVAFLHSRNVVFGCYMATMVSAQ